MYVLGARGKIIRTDIQLSRSVVTATVLPSRTLSGRVIIREDLLNLLNKHLTYTTRCERNLIVAVWRQVYLSDVFLSRSLRFCNVRLSDSTKFYISLTLKAIRFTNENHTYLSRLIILWRSDSFTAVEAIQWFPPNSC